MNSMIEMTDMMMTMTMTVMEDVVEEDAHVINTHSTHSTHFIHRSIHHTIANHTTVHTGTNINNLLLFKNRNDRNFISNNF